MALDMFINMGATIVGESADKVQGPKGDIDVLAWSWGMSQSGTTHMGSGGGAGKANFQDLSFTKYVDSASSALMISLAKGTHIPTVTLLARKAGEGQIPYITIVLSEVLVTSVSTGGSGGESSNGRSGTQVLANSLPASLFILLHIYSSHQSNSSASLTHFQSSNLLPIGIIA